MNKTLRLLEAHQKIAFVSGNFFVLHPGHIRLLKFASECGQKLHVGINNTHPTSAYPTAIERAATLKELSIVDDVVVLDEGLEKYLKHLKPDFIIKGKEYEKLFNPEQEWVSEWGGKLIFAAGDATYSSTALLRDERSFDHQIWNLPKDYMVRHCCYRENLLQTMNKFSNLKILVLGDLILDEYIQCEALGMSREDPTLVVSPQETSRFLGGAGIVAAHARALGGSVDFFTVTGNDDLASWAEEKLSEYGVTSRAIRDDSRPTTLKQRYRVGSKTMMRVSHLRQHEIGKDLQEALVKEIEGKIKVADLLIFSDFNYGVLPQVLVSKLIELGQAHKVFMAADSQASSQMGDITRYAGVDLVTPTEYEARISLRDQSSGLHIVAQDLVKYCKANGAVVTLGEAGALVIDEKMQIDRLPSLNPAPKDVSGAGDSMLVGMAMARTVGANQFQAAFIGALAAAVQVGRLGNRPISLNEINRHIV